MIRRLGCTLVLAALSGAFLVAQTGIAAESLAVEGAPADSGYNVGTLATIRATLTDAAGGSALRDYVVFAEIQYVGTTATVNVQMDRQADAPQADPQSERPGGKGGNRSGVAHFETSWPIPADAPTGLYSVVLQVEDGRAHQVVMKKKLRGFAVYKKLVQISRLDLDRTFYVAGDPIQCQVSIENLTGADLKGLRIEFSNSNYPWISLFSGEKSLAGRETANPALALNVLRDDLTLPARGQVTLPMMAAGTATFLQGQQVAVMGAGGPMRHEKVPPPETDQYTVAVWNRDRTILYDMGFTRPAIIRTATRDLPKPYSLSFTHRYNSDIDFTKYRDFYAPGETSPAITLDRSHTLYRPGDTVKLNGVLKDLGTSPAHGFSWQVQVKDSTSGGVVGVDHSAFGRSYPLKDYAAWTIPASQAPGTYSIAVITGGTDPGSHAKTTLEVAVNQLPSSLLVFCPHEDDEHSYAGLIRAAVEAGIPVQVVIFTGGDVGACERYYGKACGPNEAREFGMVRMEESAEALEHIGLTRDHLSIMGLPDGGSGEIWFHHIAVTDPFLSIYLATDHAPYENILKPNLPYARDAVIELTKQIITQFHPAMIATAHPDERHVDHRTANWFVIKACQELLAQKAIDPATVILADEAYGAGGYKPAPYRYERAPVFLSGEAAALKQEASWIYQSQDGNLSEGMRKTFDELPREEVHYRIVDWQEHAGWNE
ncbi:MAG TPA: PIG-L family deacetylase [Terriglobia bacterium]|nr:PIG-L family deacetylase [Terriglobia bacterium]